MNSKTTNSRRVSHFKKSIHAKLTVPVLAGPTTSIFYDFADPQVIIVYFVVLYSAAINQIELMG
jgi:hypothetical protein